ncbi:hypothetical protein CRU96_13095 [Malaciobacter halophilus]|nr:CHAT domain-containing protein [Malaciobacter halophilus]RYA22433.1 hypothetical protein CRU96_13095 [Malaciobacter halophilus]
MAMIDTYKNNVHRKKQEILKLNENNAKEQKKIAENMNKIISAKQSISRTKSESTIKSKLREIERYEKSISDIEKKIATNHQKISQKQKELHNEENKVIKEEEKFYKKQQQEEKKRMLESKKRESELNSRLQKHDFLHQQTKVEISKIKELPKKINVLFLASNPTDQTQLRLDEEARTIMENIRKSDYKESIEFKSVWAVRPLDILQALNEFSPTIVHFSGHGSNQDEIVFQDGEGNTKLVTKEALVQTMTATSDNIRVVFFNTCYSRNQAQEIVNHIEAAIGMNDSIGDNAARIFAAQFYSAIGFGKSIKTAFEQAKAALMLENIPEEHTPELFIQNGVSQEELVLVSK